MAANNRFLYETIRGNFLFFFYKIKVIHQLYANNIRIENIIPILICDSYEQGTYLYFFFVRYTRQEYFYYLFFIYHRVQFLVYNYIHSWSIVILNIDFKIYCYISGFFLYLPISTINIDSLYFTYMFNPISLGEV